MKRSLLVACTLSLLAGAAQAGPEVYHWGSSVQGQIGFTINGNPSYVAFGSPYYYHPPVRHVVHYYPYPRQRHHYYAPPRHHHGHHGHHGHGRHDYKGHKGDHGKPPVPQRRY